MMRYAILSAGIELLTTVYDDKSRAEEYLGSLREDIGDENWGELVRLVPDFSGIRLVSLTIYDAGEINTSLHWDINSAYEDLRINWCSELGPHATIHQIIDAMDHQSIAYEIIEHPLQDIE